MLRFNNPYVTLTSQASSSNKSTFVLVMSILDGLAFILISDAIISNRKSLYFKVFMLKVDDL